MFTLSKVLHFKTRKSYNKYLAYGHIHGVFTERVRPKIVIAGKIHHVEHCEICKQKNHHTHEHHLYHPQHRGSMKHQSRSKHKPSILGNLGKLTKLSHNGMGKTNIHSIGIKIPKVNL